MAYTSPTTRATGFLVTAAVYNADIVDNIKHLHGDDGTVNLVGKVQINEGVTPILIDEGGIDKASAGAETFNVENSGAGTVEFQVDGNKVFHAGNDGAGSGLDADNLDGVTWLAPVAATCSADTTYDGSGWDAITGLSLTLARAGTYEITATVYVTKTAGDRVAIRLARTTGTGTFSTGDGVGGSTTGEAVDTQNAIASITWIAVYSAVASDVVEVQFQRQTGAGAAVAKQDWSVAIAKWCAP